MSGTTITIIGIVCFSVSKPGERCSAPYEPDTLYPDLKTVGACAVWKLHKRNGCEIDRRIKSRQRNFNCFPFTSNTPDGGCI